MADSDEEYERRRGRDKFRRERNDYQERRGDERPRREEWTDRREVWNRDRNRRDYREYDQRRRDVRTYSPPRHDISPPVKRMRRDFNWGQAGETHGINYTVGTQRGEGDSAPVGATSGGSGVGPTQPPMMTFKQFLVTQDDTIGDKEAVDKYNEYKLDFKKQQLSDFFNSHKEEEWFKWKYHPEDSARRKQEQENGLAKRLNVFMELIESDYATKLSLDVEKSTEILKFLDAVVIRLEGGDDNDLKILEEVFYNEARNDSFGYPGKRAEDEEEGKLSDQEEKNCEVENNKAKGIDTSSEDQEGEKKCEEGEEEEGKVEEMEEGEKTENNKRKRKFKYDNENENEDSRSESESENEAAAPEEDSVTTPAEEAKPEETPNGEEQEPEQEEEGEKEVEENADADADATSVKEETSALATRSNKPRALHQTCSIFLRYLAPSITRAEVEAICKRYPGFLRVAIADPQPERRFFRRGWITFERDVNIKDICWNLNNMRLRDCELGAIVNRDLSRRIRPGSHLAVHKQVVRADIKLAAKIIQNLDARHKLWLEGTKEKEENKGPVFGIPSKNPLMHNITDHLIEEASAEEEELLGNMDDKDGNKNDPAGDIELERDETLVKVLDRLLMYLRIVHSVDYYNSSEYPNEDEMPNRCGIMHARTTPPMNRLCSPEVEEYIGGFESKMQTFLAEIEHLSEEEILRLGKKEVDSELEKFVQTNTQELAADKWLCPLSGKKFKAPEFVRKHIFNKHAERVEEVKKDVEYFNNYLRDPKRPLLPAHTPARTPTGTDGARTNVYTTGYHGGGQYGGYGGGGRGSQGGYSGGYGSQNYGRGYNSGGYRGGGSQHFYERRAAAAVAAAAASGRRGGRDPRELINYRDLDAPDVNDAF